MSTRKLLILGLAIAIAISGWLLCSRYAANDVSDISSSQSSSQDDSPDQPMRDLSAQSAASRSQGGYAESKDLYALTLQLKPRSEAGDGEASRLIASAYQECWLYALNPTGFMNDMALRGQVRPDLKEKMNGLARRTTERCYGFAGQKIGPKVANLMLEKAAAQGDLSAEAQLLGSALQSLDAATAGNQLKDLAERIVTSRDPDAYLAIAPFMGQVADGQQGRLHPLPVGSSLAEASWHIAACKMGADCSATGPTVTRMCLFGGINCGLKSLEQFYLQEVLPPADQRRLWQQVGLLASNHS